MKKGKGRPSVKEGEGGQRRGGEGRGGRGLCARMPVSCIINENKFKDSITFSI